MDEPVSHHDEASSITPSEKVAQIMDARIVSVLERMTDGFVALDHKWRYTYVNHQAEQLLGRRKDDLLGRVIWEVYPEAVGTLFYQNITKQCAPSNPFYLKSFILQARNGLQCIFIHHRKAYLFIITILPDINAQKKY